MISEFDWCGCTAISNEEKQEIESSIRDTYEARGDQELKPCHDGDVKVQVDITGPLFSELVGNITCSCGKKYCTFRGASDASKVVFESVLAP